MKILQVMSSCSKESGVAQVIVRYYRYLHTSVKFDFLMFSRAENNFEEEIRSLGGNCFYIKRPSMKNINLFRRQLSDFFDQHIGEYDAIQLHDLYLNPFVLKIAQSKGVKVRIAHSHTTEYSENFLPKIRNKILYMTLKKYANVFFACSKDAGIFAFGKHIIDHNKFYVVNNAIDISQYIYSAENRTKIRSCLKIEEDEIVIGNVGRFSPQKNHLFLIKIFKELCKLRGKHKLVLVGTGEGIASAKQLCEDLAISDKVVFLGIRQDVGDIMSAMDIFCLPSIFEGLGNVLIEAQANSLPCIASDVVPTEAAILPSYRTMSLKKGASEWAETIFNTQLIRDYNAFEQVSRAGFNIQSAAERLLSIYDSIL